MSTDSGKKDETQPQDAPAANGPASSSELTDAELDAVAGAGVVLTVTGKTGITIAGAEFGSAPKVRVP